MRYIYSFGGLAYAVSTPCILCIPFKDRYFALLFLADPKLARAHASAGVEGDLPSPVNPKPGCRFCGRCPYAKPICSEQTPAMKEAAPGHFVACHLY